MCIVCVEEFGAAAGFFFCVFPFAKARVLEYRRKRKLRKMMA